MVILSYRSPYLREILSTNKKENDKTLIHIKLPNISSDIFNVVLRYIYGGTLVLEECDNSDIIKILVAANELNLQEVIFHLQSFLIQNKSSWMEQNFNLIYQTSFEYNSLSDLQKFCTEFIFKQPQKIFNSPDFISIPEKSLISLIRHENFQMSQVQIWEHVIKWGIAQNPGLSSDPSSYSNEDFNALKNSLQNCIPFIKFTKFTSKEFLNKVYPYKKIIPEELCDNLIEYFLDRDGNSRDEKEHSITNNNTLGNNDEDLEKLVISCKELAIDGDAEAQYNLARCYERGIGVEKNNIKAFEYYKKSADQGHLNAQSELGYCYYDGIGTELNIAKAFELYKIAAERGHIVAQNNLGALYEKGKGTEKNLEKAIYWYNKAAENGSYLAQDNLGRCYRFGIGVEKNDVKAFEYYKKSADQENLDAQYHLGYYYDSGIGTEVNKTKALELYKIASERGHIIAQHMLGIFYEEAKDIEKNLEKAVYWYTKAAENKSAVAQYNLGRCYE
ncbi:hypothetical protein C1645_726618, partial [Glomus cerebriforme]